MKNIKLYSDGACSGNPGPGGFAAILVYGEKEKVIVGGDKATTNNRMELSAVIEGLFALKESCAVTVVTDSKYVVDAVSKGWLYGWKKKGWRNSANKPTPNVDLWEKLLPLLKQHQITFEWIKGHSGHPYNERCDVLAVEYYKKNL